MDDFAKAFEQVKNALPADCISQDREDLISHGSSSWTYHDPRVLPGAVLYPRNTDDVSMPLCFNGTILRFLQVVRIVKAAHQYAIPVVAFSGGSESRHRRALSNYAHLSYQLLQPAWKAISMPHPFL